MTRPVPASGEAPAVYFLSDYGLDDEFVGVVHAVLHRRAPSVPVIDLSHRVPPFDVAAGAAVLGRAAPSLGAGVVLAVVDPGVGTDRRPVAVGVRSAAGGPGWLVGPDNGLLIAAADALGGAERVLVLTRPDPGHGMAGATFDGRDLFAPAAAHLVLGNDPDDLGSSADPRTLVGSPEGAPEPLTGTGRVLLAAVGWIDRFGNVQLRIDPGAVVDLLGSPGARLQVAVGPLGVPDGMAGSRTDDRPEGFGAWTEVRRVTAFSDLEPGQVGLLLDANGRPALVIDRSSAAAHLGIDGPGTTLALRAGS